MNTKKILLAAALAVVTGVLAQRPAMASSPITIDGVVYDKTTLVSGAVVVAWCGDLSHFGGSDTTDTNGHFIIHTNSDDCPFGSEITVTTDTDYDGTSNGAGHAPTHTSTTVSIYLGSYTHVAIPEYTWLTAGGAGVASVAAIGVARRSSKRKS